MDADDVKRIIFETLKAIIVLLLICSFIIGNVVVKSKGYVDVVGTIVNIQMDTTFRKGRNHTNYHISYEYTYNNILYTSVLTYSSSQFDDREVGITETIKIDPNEPTNIKDTPLIRQYLSFAKLGSVVISISAIIRIIKLILNDGKD